MRGGRRCPESMQEAKGACEPPLHASLLHGAEDLASDLLYSRDLHTHDSDRPKSPAAKRAPPAGKRKAKKPRRAPQPGKPGPKTQPPPSTARGQPPSNNPRSAVRKPRGSPRRKKRGGGTPSAAEPLTGLGPWQGRGGSEADEESVRNNVGSGKGEKPVRALAGGSKRQGAGSPARARTPEGGGAHGKAAAGAAAGSPGPWDDLLVLLGGDTPASDGNGELGCERLPGIPLLHLSGGDPDPYSRNASPRPFFYPKRLSSRVRPGRYVTLAGQRPQLPSVSNRDGFREVCTPPRAASVPPGREDVYSVKSILARRSAAASNVHKLPVGRVTVGRHFGFFGRELLVS
ncbi:hypothetical protein DIPPA_19408 [Diplonema papillatum]|nr:hypothetical protein DIPPA_19408 [Diplonema papillatum]